MYSRCGFILFFNSEGLNLALERIKSDPILVQSKMLVRQLLLSLFGHNINAQKQSEINILNDKKLEIRIFKRKTIEK